MNLSVTSSPHAFQLLIVTHSVFCFYEYPGVASEWNHSVGLLCLLNIYCGAFDTHPWCVAHFKIAFLWGWTCSWAAESTLACTRLLDSIPSTKKIRKKSKKLVFIAELILHCAFHVLFVCSSVSGHSCCFYFLVVSNVNMNEYTPRSTMCDFVERPLLLFSI